MNEPDPSAFDRQLRDCVCDTVPPMVESRLRARLADFRAQLTGPERVAATRVRRVWLGGSLRLGLICAAAGLVSLVVGIMLRPRTSLAEVATALLQQPWVHLRITTGDVDQGEIWFSAARSVVVTRFPAQPIQYQDYRASVVDSYDPKEGVVYHAPIVWHSSVPKYQKEVGALATLLRGEKAPEKPLANLGLLGSLSLRDQTRVLSQRVERVTDAGRTWLDYHLTVADPAARNVRRMLFRVDAVTKLPALLRVDHQSDGKTFTVETRYDYSDSGPADIYAVGVPRTAKRVDRTLTGELEHIVETIRAGRVRMDNYRAFRAKYFDGEVGGWTARSIFYRKGMNFRIDYAGGGASKVANAKRPGPGEDRGKWWREHAKSVFPMYVVRGTSTFTTMRKNHIEPNGTGYVEIASVLEMESDLKPGESFPPDYSAWPEFACRPPLAIGDPYFEPALDMHPTDGPPGCVKLTVRHTPAGDKRASMPDEQRYWLDPQRDFIVMRIDFVVRDAAGRERVAERDTIDETARSPHGVWHATKMRRHFPAADGHTKQADEISELYVDFNVDLPDSLFEQPKVGRVR